MTGKPPSSSDRTSTLGLPSSKMRYTQKSHKGLGGAKCLKCALRPRPTPTLSYVFSAFLTRSAPTVRTAAQSAGGGGGAVFL